VPQHLWSACYFIVFRRAILGEENLNINFTRDVCR
jgi:hypothetical protein